MSDWNKTIQAIFAEAEKGKDLGPLSRPERQEILFGDETINRVAKFLSDEFRECPPYWDAQSEDEHESWRVIARALFAVSEGKPDPRDMYGRIP
jgi:hypothetical protein